MHPVQLAGPLLFTQSEDDFVAALQRRLQREPWPARGWPAGLHGDRLGARGEQARLLHPLSGQFTLLLVDAHCQRPGQPALDPARIVARGFVLRRLWQGRCQAWRVDAEGQALGWRDLPAGALDADPEARRPPPRSGSSALDALLAQRRPPPPAAERVLPLWSLPPAVQQACGRSLLAGLVPTAGAAAALPPPAERQTERQAERQAQLAALREPAGAARAQLADWLSPWFTPASALTPPRPGRDFEPGWFRQDAMPEDEDRFAAFIEQIGFELDAFGAGAARWQPLLARLPLWRHEPLSLQPWPYARYSRIDSLDFFRAAVAVVREGEGRVRMPDRIGPRPGEAPPLAAADWLEPLAAQLAAQHLEQAQPQGLFDEDEAEYQLRAFLRVREACGEQLVWSEASPRFRIAPWYEGGIRPAPAIKLPRLDRQSLAALKPGGGFLMPADVRRLLQPNGAQGLLAGSPRRGAPGMDWMLQLSIPVMTVCAMVAMMIVLNLLNAVFRWLPFAISLLPRPRS